MKTVNKKVREAAKIEELGTGLTPTIPSPESAMSIAYCGGGGGCSSVCCYCGWVGCL